MCAAVGIVVTCSSVAVSATSHGASAAGYSATIVRTADGIPHITASNFGSLGYGYGYALASDDICTMTYARWRTGTSPSRHKYPVTSAPTNPLLINLDSDIFWQSVIDHHTIQKLLAIRTDPDAIGP